MVSLDSNSPYRPTRSSSHTPPNHFRLAPRVHQSHRSVKAWSLSEALKWFISGDRATHDMTWPSKSEWRRFQSNYQISNIIECPSERLVDIIRRDKAKTSIECQVTWNRNSFAQLDAGWTSSLQRNIEIQNPWLGLAVEPSNSDAKSKSGNAPKPTTQVLAGITQDFNSNFRNFQSKSLRMSFINHIKLHIEALPVLCFAFQFSTDTISNFLFQAKR